MSDGNQTVPERLSSLEAKTDRVLEELSGIKTAFGELGQMLCKQGKDIERHETILKVVRIVAVWIFAPVFGAVGIGAIVAVFLAFAR